MAHQPKLYSSQELVLHQVSAEQSFSPVSLGPLPFPTSPASAPRRGGALPGHFSPTTPLVQTPGGSSSTAPVAIALPEIRLRSEWSSSLHEVEPFELPHEALRAPPVGPGRRVEVQYIVDGYDLNWLASRAGGVVSTTARGKTGGSDSPRPSLGDVGVLVLEDVITAFELAAYRRSEIPLERISAAHLLCRCHFHLSLSQVEEVHQYWLMKREATGGQVPCIPELRRTVREDNQTALCHAEVLGDCPLPFKQRDWSAPIIERKPPPPRGQGMDEKPLVKVEKRSRSESLPAERPMGSLGDVAYDPIISSAVNLSYALLRREELTIWHTHLALYELAALRTVSHYADAPAEVTSASEDSAFCTFKDADIRWTDPKTTQSIVAAVRLLESS